ncbi:MAG: hypothetical protein CMF01_05230 [Hyphomonas sp.]|nr:hypothetical protein [Hyphomonas sp.]
MVFGKLYRPLMALFAGLLPLTGCLSMPGETPQPTRPTAPVSASTPDTAASGEAKDSLAAGRGRFTLAEWGGPDLPVWTYAPVGRDITNMPIVIVMHGVGRDADRYRDEWSALAQLEGFIVAAPEFSKADWPGAAGYNFGAVRAAGGVESRPEAEWAFSAIEPLFEAIVVRTGSRQHDYVIFGHSAGAQFVHRFLFYKPNVRVRRYIVANAGWYTMPDYDEAYPYGLAKADVPEGNLKAALAKDVVVLLGTQDIDPNDPSLRRSPEAMRQGAFRFARGQAFHEAGKQAAARLGVDFNWQIATVEGAVHSNGQMAFGAVPLIVDPVFLVAP